MFNQSKTNLQNQNKKSKNPRNRCDLGDDFVAPDGGWGWIVCLAAGLTHLCSFPLLQQFGLILRDRLLDLGFNISQITTLTNVNTALSSFTGLVNGPMFRRFTFRQVALFGSSLIVIGVFFTAMSESFFGYILCFSTLYGIGIGLNLSSSSLALNTYFKEKRRRASSFSWTITSCGPIVMPYITTYFVDFYGVSGTLILFSGLCLHCIACALIYQPVLKHVRKPIQRGVSGIQDEKKPFEFCEYCQEERRKKRNGSFFSTPYLDDNEKPSYDVAGDLGTPMLSHANDGWFGSVCSLSSTDALSKRRRTLSNASTLNDNSFQTKKTTLQRKMSLQKTIDEEEQNGKSLLKGKYSSEMNETPFCKKSNKSMTILMPDIKNGEKTSVHIKPANKCTCPNGETKPLLKKHLVQEINEEQSGQREKMTLCQKIAIFFDLDLLKDHTYVILMTGLTIANFTEINFALLTPFILSDYGLERGQIAFTMSILGAVDTSARFAMPFLTERINWDNQVLFMIGISGLAIGRTVVAHVRDYNSILFAFAWIGFFKAFRTIFMTLVLPSYIPLARLPAASGLQLATMGIFSLFAGPLVGLIRDTSDYTVTLYCLNTGTLITVIVWIIDMIYRAKRERRMGTDNNATEKDNIKV